MPTYPRFLLLSFLLVGPFDRCLAQSGQPTLPAPVAGPDKLSLKQALLTGLRDNPQITASRYTVQSSLENYYSQRAPINPTLSYSALNNTVAPASYSGGFSQGVNYSAYLTLETNGANRYRAGQARGQYNQAQFDAAAGRLSLKLSIANAYVALQAANEALQVELKVFENVRKLTELTQHRLEVGAGTEADATRARIAEIQEEQNVIADVANVDVARATLNTQLGRPQGLPVDAGDPLVYTPIPFPTLSELTKQAEQNRPEIQSAVANLQSLQATVGLERSAFFPNTVLGKDFGSDGVLYMGLSMPLDLGGISRSVSKAKADVKAQEAQVEAVRQSIDLDVKSSYVNWIAAKQQVDTYASGLLKMSETLLEQMRHGYDLGANTIVDVLTAENTYRSVESAYAAAVGNYQQAVFTLKHAIGDLPEGASPSPKATPEAKTTP